MRLPSPLHGISVLRRPGRLLAEELLSFDRPIWFAKHLTREERQISRPRGDDFIGLRRFGDEPHRAGENVRLFANCRA
jgi:hypothetical protein